MVSRCAEFEVSRGAEFEFSFFFDNSAVNQIGKLIFCSFLKSWKRIFKFEIEI